MTRRNSATSFVVMLLPDVIGGRSYAKGGARMRQTPVDTSAAETVSTSDMPSVGVAALAEPSADLLDRALVGWERFLDTFEGVPDE